MPQDYRTHHDEVCAKLVSIMRERLSANLRQLPALAAAWPAGGERPELPAPSSFATTAAKQLQVTSAPAGAGAEWRWWARARRLPCAATGGYMTHAARARRAHDAATLPALAPAARRS